MTWSTCYKEPPRDHLCLKYKRPEDVEKGQGRGSTMMVDLALSRKLYRIRTTHYTAIGRDSLTALHRCSLTKHSFICLWLYSEM
ncbi:hypothetical protein M3J09_011882 [Ascochyta lentis]